MSLVSVPGWPPERRTFPAIPPSGSMTLSTSLVTFLRTAGVLLLLGAAGLLWASLANPQRPLPPSKASTLAVGGQRTPPAPSVSAGVSSASKAPPVQGRAATTQHVEDGGYYYSLDEQRQIARAARQLWRGSDPHDNWDCVATRIADACGASMRIQEAFLLASYHPRAKYEWRWRSEFEDVLFRRWKWVWAPDGEPECQLMRRVVMKNAAD